MQYVCPRSPRNAKRASIFCLLRAKSTLLDETTKKVHTECYFRIAFSWIQRVNSNKNWWRKGQISERIFLSPLARYYSHQLHPNTQWAEMKLAKTKKHIKTNKRASEKFCHTNGLHLMCVCVFSGANWSESTALQHNCFVCARALSQPTGVLFIVRPTRGIHYVPPQCFEWFSRFNRMVRAQ